MSDSYRKDVRVLLKANTNVLSIVSYEWQRVHALLFETSKEMRIPLYVWSSSFGLQKFNKNGQKEITDQSELYKDVLEMLMAFYSSDDFKNGILLMEDIHPYIEPQHQEVIRWVREFTRLDRQSQKHIVLLSPTMNLPIELEKDVPIIEIPLPDRTVLKQVLQMVASEYELAENLGDVEYHPDILDAALGLTTMEAQRAFSKAAVMNKHITTEEIPIIIREKEQIIKQGKILEYYHPDFNFKMVGGMDNLKNWLVNRGHGFSEDARNYGLEFPKGVLLLGVQGCGKSLTAKAIAQEWNLPLLRFDLGRVYGGIVGQSEANIRKALQVSEALAPCILWIDEIEKGISGMGSSDVTDGGTTARVFGTLLTWMQEKQKPVFMIATANDISKMPPELLRKGRFDEIFFVDLPSKKERESIFKIHIEKKDRKVSDYNIKKLVEITSGYSGAEIEEIVKEALYLAYNDGRRKVEDKDFITAIENVVPLSSTMMEGIDSLRKWADVRARKASSHSIEKLNFKEKKVPVLKQEKMNPFISNE